jgi:hypothetical protein
MYLVHTNPVKRQLATLTPEEDKVWDKTFEHYLGEGYSDSRADRAAWKDLQQQFPRLKKYDGIRCEKVSQYECFSHPQPMGFDAVYDAVKHRKATGHPIFAGAAAREPVPVPWSKDEKELLRRRGK